MACAHPRHHRTTRSVAEPVADDQTWLVMPSCQIVCVYHAFCHSEPRVAGRSARRGAGNECPTTGRRREQVVSAAGVSSRRIPRRPRTHPARGNRKLLVDRRLWLVAFLPGIGVQILILGRIEHRPQTGAVTERPHGATAKLHQAVSPNGPATCRFHVQLDAAERG